MDEKKQFADHKRLLGELVKKVYGSKTIDYTIQKDHFDIMTGIGSGLVSKFSLTTDTFMKRMQTLFTYTLCDYTDKTVSISKGSKKKDLILHEAQASKETKKNFAEFILKALKAFIGADEMEQILATCVRDNDLHRMRYVVTTDSIFDVMKNYSSYHGIPMLCTKEQFSECKKTFNGSYVSKTTTEENTPDVPETATGENVPAASETTTDEKASAAPETATDDNTPDANVPSLIEFFHDNPHVANSCGKLLCDRLNDVLLSIFAKEDISSEKLEADYQCASERIKRDLTDLFELESRKIICTYQDDGIKRIVIIDQDCPIDKLKKTVLYYPDCAPVLSEWKIPEHEYRTYRAPAYQSDDIMDLLLHPARLNSQHFPIADLQIEKITASPISKIRIPYSQSMFYDFQIQYKTSEERFQGDGLFQLYNIDVYISAEIKARWSKQVERHWKAVLNSMMDIISKITATNFIPIIEETPKSSLSANESPEAYLALFHQRKSVQLKADTFSAFLPKELIQRHYYIQLINSPKSIKKIWKRYAKEFWKNYASLFGNDFVAQCDMPQVAYVLIPLIGSFVSALNQNLNSLAAIIAQIVSKKEFDTYVRMLNQYLESGTLDKAIQAWDSAYSSNKKKLWQQKRRSVQSVDVLFPDYKQLALMAYTDRNGNLIRNLKSVLEEYLYCLQKLC